MLYINESMCRAEVFRYVYENLSDNEPAPQYEAETRGLDGLRKVLTFVQDNDFYPTFSAKAAYLLCGIIEGHYFSNGNKRLGIALFLQFLALNNAIWEDLDKKDYHALLQGLFPHMHWEDNSNIGTAHALFLYNLAIVVGDCNTWGNGGFDTLKAKVTRLCAHLYHAE